MLVVGSVIGYLLDYAISFLMYYGILLGMGGILFLFWRTIIIRCIVVLVLVGFIGFFRGSLDSQDVFSQQIMEKNPEVVFMFDGTVVNEPRLTQKVQIIPVLVNGFRENIHDATWKSASLRMKIITHHGRFYHEGDRLSFICTPDIQKSYGIKGVMVQSAKDITCFYPIVRRLKEGNGSGAYLGQWRTMLTHKMSSVISTSTAGFLAGILFGGGDELISKNTKELFQKTGTSHILAISGYNVSLVSLVIFWIFQLCRLGRKRAGLMSIITICAFVLFTGAHASSIRAAGMASAVLAANFFGRQSSSLAALVMVAGVMVFFSPAVFLFDAGFHLSFLATLGLVFGLTNERVQYSLRASFTVLVKQTLIAIGITTPYVIFVFGTFSLVSPLVNMIVVPFVPLLMMVGLGVIGASFVGHSFFVSGFLFVAEAFVRTWMSVIEWFSHIPLAALSIPHYSFSGAALIVSYGCMALGIWAWKKKKRYDKIIGHI